MPAWLKTWLDRVRTSFWFTPAVMAVLAIAAALLIIRVDHHVPIERDGPGQLLFAGEPEAVQAILTTIIGAVITVVSVVFSIVVVGLTFAAGQLGPRLLRGFMRDRVTQAALGLFVATFVYCLIVLQAVQRGIEDPFVPHLATALAVALTLASLGGLIYFIHHIALSVQADTVVARASEELHHAIGRLLPAADDGPQDDAAELVHTGPTAAVEPGREGEIAAIDRSALLKLAGAKDLRVRCLRTPGDFAFRRVAMFEVSPADRVDDAVRHRLREAVVVQSRRTTQQDLRYGFRQLTEVALRALSPGINDPYTAVSCVYRIAAGLAEVARRPTPSRRLTDSEGVTRVELCEVSFASLVESSISPILTAAADHRVVYDALIEGIEAVDQSHEGRLDDALAELLAAARREAHQRFGDGYPAG